MINGSASVESKSEVESLSVEYPQEDSMKKRFSEEQIVSILREAETGLATKNVCRTHGIAEQTF